MRRETMYDYITDELREAFNDVCLREMNLGLTKEDLVYDIESNTIVQIDGLFLRYCDSKYTIINQATEARFDLIDNSKFMSMLVSHYCTRELNKRNCKVLGINQYITNNNTYRGYVSLTIEPAPVMTYNGEPVGYACIKDIRSDEYINESVRLLSLVCKVNETDSMYDLSRLDVREEG